ncbi:hypothetical protein PENSPDRAFT_734714 [Peniophora sp. CONT]|nr:hypothetical protein PENSPDRAFT_734714 [Peniophora sp. CONT]
MTDYAKIASGIRSWQQRLPTAARVCFDVIGMLLLTVAAIVAILLYCVYFLYTIIVTLLGFRSRQRDITAHECTWPDQCPGCQKNVTNAGLRLRAETFPDLVNKVSQVAGNSLLMSHRDVMMSISSLAMALYIKIEDAIEKKIRLQDLDPSPSLEASHTLVKEMSLMIDRTLKLNESLQEILIAIPSRLLTLEQASHDHSKRRSLLCTSINNMVMLLGQRLYDDADLKKLVLLGNTRAWDQLGSAFINVAHSYTVRREKVPRELALFALDWWCQSPPDVSRVVHAQIFGAAVGDRDYAPEVVGLVVKDSVVSVYGAHRVLCRMCLQLDDLDLLGNELAWAFKGHSHLLLESDVRKGAFACRYWESVFAAWYRQLDCGTRSLDANVWCSLSAIIIGSFYAHLSGTATSSDVPGSREALPVAFMPEAYDYCAHAITHIAMLPSASSELLEACFFVCQYYKTFASQLSTPDIRRSGSRRQSGSRDNLPLQDVWWPTLETLRSIEASGSMTVRQREIQREWQGLGLAVGLNERKERVRFERLEADSRKAATAFCARKGCRYNCEKPSERLRVCKGCGDTAYCSYFCQKTDWKEGNHKTSCKRLTSSVA